MNADVMKVGPAPEPSVLASVQKFVTTAQLLKTLAAMVVGLVVSSLAVYNHFAKAAELAELACKVVEQNEINNEMINTSREIQATLKLLKENFEATTDRPISAQFMAKEIAVAIGKIERSMGNVDLLRKSSQKKAIIKDGKC